MPKGSTLITTKVIITLLIIHWRSALQCSTASAHLPEYVCNDQEFFGKGASGEAFLVHKDEKRYILKAQRISDPDARDQALTDLKYLMMFRNQPYLVQLIESKQTAEYLFEVLEFGENGNLENFYERRKDFFADWRATLEFFLKILKGVSTMHSKNVIHTDIKFANIVVSKEFDPILIDFDLSVPANKPNYGRGTSEYMDPVIMEAWGRFQSVYNEFRDIYSLGVTLHYLTQDQYPFTGKSRHEILREIKNNKYSFKKGTHVDVAKIIHSCLRLKENDRKTLKEIIEMTESALKLKSDLFLNTEIEVSNNEPLRLSSNNISTFKGLSAKTSLLQAFFILLIGFCLLLAGAAFVALKVSFFNQANKNDQNVQQNQSNQMTHALDQQA